MRDFEILDDSELESVSGGNSSQTNLPIYSGPTMHAPGSIALGDTLDNTLTDDQLPNH